MKRALLLLLLSVSTLWGQFLPDIPDRLSYVAQLNGTSQYFSKTSPTKMDLNGSELITLAANRDFEDSVGTWTGSGNHTIVRTTGDKKAGSASGLISSSGAGDTTTNYVTLPANAFTVLVNGTKATIETWARSGTATTTLSLNIGDTTLTSGNLSTTPGTFTKVVFNINVTAARIDVPFRWYLNKAVDSVFVDVNSLTQAYDIACVYKIKTSHPSGTGTIFHGGTGSIYLEMQISPNRQNIKLSDGTTIVTLTGASIPVNDGRERTFAFTLNRTGSLDQYVYGGAAGTAQSVVSVGKISIGAFFVGIFNGTINLYNGQIGDLILVRYPSLPSNIASWIAHVNTQRFIPEPPGGGTTVLRLFGKENSAYDQSGTQGVLTNTGSTPIIPR